VFVHGLRSTDLEEALLRSFPAVLFAHGYYGTCATGHKLHRRPSVRACTRPLTPACLGLNYALGCGARDPRALLAAYRQQRRRAGLIPSYRRLVVASSWMRDELARNGADRRLVEVVPPIPQVPRDERLPAPRPVANRVALVGRLAPTKGGGLLVKAMALATARLGRRLELVVIGSGPDRQRLEDLARREGIPARFHGWLGEAALADALRGVDLLAMPSVWPEPFGLAGIEAAGVGVPCVAFDHGGIPDWNEPGVTGELAQARPPSASALADALVRALADPSRLASLGRNAWERAARFGARAHVIALEAVLAAAAGARPAQA
jgi:glycosyltransferase involved in cell wall biosynthesis